MLRKISITVAAAALVALVGLPDNAHAQQPSVNELSKQVEALQAQLSGVLQQLETIQKQSDQTAEETTVLIEDMEDMDDRVMKPERHSALDKIRLSGSFRTQVHSIDGNLVERIDGANVQKDLVNTLFYFGATGQPPQTPDLSDVDQLIGDNYGDYLNYLNNVVSFDFIKSQLQGLQQQDPALAQQLMGLLASQPDSFIPGDSADNNMVYTNRLRIRTQADVGENVVFDGRLAMYKVWGDSTGVQVFNGQPTSINWDGTTANVPNSDILRVERAYFTWSDILDMPLYLSVGRRPSVGGVPLNLREDEPRGGTPLGSLFNYQFDGITVGYHLNDYSTMRICYGLGFESEWGNGSEFLPSDDRLHDTWFIGFVWDILDTPNMFVQANWATAQNIGDGFNGLVVMPFDPVTGQDAPPALLRYTPSDNIGNMDLGGVVVTRNDGPFDYFASVNYSSSDPHNTTTPFGGMLSDPFDTPTSEDGYMYYLGGRYNFANGDTKAGVEFNHGSQYWFNFSTAEDDFLGPKTSVRGDVFEVYLTHTIRDRFIFKLDYVLYDYAYSGSGWILGTPKNLDDLNILAAPAYEDVGKFMLSFDARF